jgi:peptide/nickel transport system permease protein
VIGLGTLLAVSILVFAATEILPGNAAVAILGRSATPARLRALDLQLHLNHSVVHQYVAWFSGLLTGHLGTSLSTNGPLWGLVGPRLGNSAVLVLLAGVIGTLVGLGLGMLSAVRKDSVTDQAVSVATLAVTALPEFVVAIALIMLFATLVFHWLPAVSFVPPGTSILQVPRLLILPVATLVVVTVPYLARMTRAAIIEALESDYVEMAKLKGASGGRILFVHALPNAMAPIAQVIGLNFLYLAGGIGVVEYVFAFPGIGQGLVNAVTDRDVPVIQVVVLLLSAFYIFVNITTDVVALAVTPTRRLPR